MEIVKGMVLANSGFLDALGFTGGEPCLQPKAVLELCTWAKNRGLATFLNTNASIPRVVKDLVEKNLLDYLAFDLKAPLRAEAYKTVAGLDERVDKAERMIANIKKTIEVCKQYRVTLEARTTVVPTLLDDEASIREIATVAKDCSIYVLQEFSPGEAVLDVKLRKLKPTPRELLVKLAKIALEEGVKEVRVRTRSQGMERVIL